MKSLLILLPVIFLLSCKSHVDTIYYNASIYTINKGDTICNAMAVKDGKIVSLGNKEQLFDNYDTKNKVDLNGKFVYPGFIDAHCHFINYALNKSRIDLTADTIWKAVILDLVYTTGYGWGSPVVGYGLDFSKWEDSTLPVNDELNRFFPTQPVILIGTDNQSCIANNKALEMAGITADTKIAGGEIILAKNKPTGMLLGNAADSAEKLIPQPSKEEIEKDILEAQKKCLAVGLTTIDDAGITKQMVDIIDSLQKQNKLKLRVYAMLADNAQDREYYLKRPPYKTNRLHVCAFKCYVDGSLGFRSALMSHPYTDDKENYGIQLNTAVHYSQLAELCYQNGYQLCAHAVGDSANRLILHIYGDVLKGPNDKRWRIEQCQVIAPGDFDLFADYNIIPSIQATQATSDLNFSEQRLGVYRIRGAYAYSSLLFENGCLANGSNFPMQDINPLYGYYAAIARKDQKGNPEGGFEPENCLNREQALSAMTIWAAKANFEDDEKGSLIPGKLADFVVLDKNIMTIPYEQTFSTKVLATYINGELVFKQ